MTTMFYAVLAAFVGLSGFLAVMALVLALLERREQSRLEEAVTERLPVFVAQPWTCWRCWTITREERVQPNLHLCSACLAEYRRVLNKKVDA